MGRDGSLVAAWSDDYEIKAQRFAPDGKLRGAWFVVSDQFEPAIAAGRRGPAVVVWAQRHVRDGRTDIYARVLPPDR